MNAWWASSRSEGLFPETYDGQGNVSAIGRYDGSGTTLQERLCLRHDPLGRLVLVGRTSTTYAPGAAACLTDAEVTEAQGRFKYDWRNLRVASQRNGQWTYTAFDAGGRPLSEFQLTGSPEAPWSKVRDYLWLDGRLLAQVEYGPGGAPSVYYAHLDHLGQPRALTNGAGQVVWASYQRPYGEVLEKTVPDPQTGRTVVTNLRLPGQYDERLLGSVGLQGPYYNWNRWYLPSAGRYLELDPIAKAGGFNGDWGPEWYGYVSGNPLSFIDPTGLYSCNYSVATHTMSCWPDNPQNPIFVSDKWTAGNDLSLFGGPCRDNPACFMFGDGGPPPHGKYRLGNRRYGDGKPSWRPMTPTRDTRMYGRFGINTHPCGPHPDTCSTGCLAATEQHVIDTYNQWMDLEVDNWITVIP